MLKFLGTGGAYSTGRGNNCAYLIIGNELFFFDFGMDCFEHACKKGLFSGINRVHFFITHLHGDHIGGLSTAINYCYDSVCSNDSSRINVYFPTESLRTMLSLQGIPAQWYNFCINRWDEIPVDSMDEVLEYEFHEVNHTNNLDYANKTNTFAIELTIPKQACIYYSGDASEFASCLENPYAFDFIYHEVTMRNIAAHMNYEKLKELTKNPDVRSRFYLMHLDDTFDEAKARQDGFHVVTREE